MTHVPSGLNELFEEKIHNIPLCFSSVKLIVLLPNRCLQMTLIDPQVNQSWSQRSLLLANLRLKNTINSVVKALALKDFFITVRLQSPFY